MRVIDKYYKKVNDTDVIKMARNLNLTIDWVIEAGCHDGSDTMKISKQYPKASIYAFEPDPVARKKAQERFSQSKSTKIELHEYGLSDVNSTTFLNFSSGVAGTGSSEISAHGPISIETRKLDSFLKFDSSSEGLLWLDVEGHAVNALSGMQEILKQVTIAKIEVQMHDMSLRKKSDYKEVLTILQKAGLCAISTPIHPGYFGDIIFVRKTVLSKSIRLISLLLRIQMTFLHAFLYPLLKKPKKIDN